ncbi:NADP-dependent 3-hydroxy acid dehydrogenase YdfG [Lentzea atacamensis]|uniref:NADP-dependent 3-hydroxy acid dehydrogenase YdfG n=1 Tax=Lentzea atacamensis TaxID=531938 RepID=A0ABX9DVG8_9PSEU|nr:NADP-dependent 3-hydroxy acid dehydrogenase YdfG [Lentzea atacamensis]
MAAGDQVVATARRIESLDDLVRTHPRQVVPVRMDVTNHDAIRTTVANVIAEHGRIDVLVNNAGRTHVGAVEETTDEELRDLFEAQRDRPAEQHGRPAVVRGLRRAQRHEVRPGRPSEALADEMKSFGVKVLIVEPGSFRTSLFSGYSGSKETEIYADSVGRTRQMITAGNGKQPGDPAKTAAAILTALDAAETPLRPTLGGDAVDAVLTHLDDVKAEIALWEKVPPRDRVRSLTWANQVKFGQIAPSLSRPLRNPEAMPYVPGS